MCVKAQPACRDSLPLTGMSHVLCHIRLLLLARALSSSPPSNEQIADEKLLVLFIFFNVIIYCVNIHCSYTDNRLQSTGVYSDSLP